MFRSVLAVICIFTSFHCCLAQYLYYRHVPTDSIRLFRDTSSKISYKGDTIENYRHQFNYVLRFFPRMQYDKIDVIFTPSRRISKAKPTFLCLFQSPEKRKYKVYFSTKSKSALDSVTLKHLDLNAQVGLIARQVSHIEDLSTSGFFDILFWHFRQLSKKAKNRREKVIEQKVLEVGLGHQLLALRKVNDERLQIERWTDARAYSYYFKHYRKRYMDQETIINFINDLPVYAQHQFK